MGSEHNYRVYLIGDHGHISGRTDIVCVTDEAAKTRAKRGEKSRAGELAQ
jgi:hypothetical protein